jgi:hypothetical protein
MGLKIFVALLPRARRKRHRTGLYAVAHFVSLLEWFDEARCKPKIKLQPFVGEDYKTATIGCRK